MLLPTTQDRAPIELWQRGVVFNKLVTLSTILTLKTQGGSYELSQN